MRDRVYQYPEIQTPETTMKICMDFLALYPRLDQIHEELPFCQHFCKFKD